jgi:hypothetical protein
MNNFTNFTNITTDDFFTNGTIATTSDETFIEEYGFYMAVGAGAIVITAVGIGTIRKFFKCKWKGFSSEDSNRV